MQGLVDRVRLLRLPSVEEGSCSGTQRNASDELERALPKMPILQGRVDGCAGKGLRRLFATAVRRLVR